MSTNHPANIDIAAALAEAQELYRARNPKSLAQYEDACAALPGGNTRSAIFVDPFPLTMTRGEGSHLWDLDGHEYVDFLSEFTAGLFGHSHPKIRGALAAILIEPMLGGSGCIPATREFLSDLRALASETGAVLIFDEVMTSRLAPGGLQEAHGILPDMTTLGKYVGGGMSFGAFGGAARIMEWFDPRRADSFQHAGTFNNNVLTMNAGLVGLTEVYTPERARALNARGDQLRERLNAVVRRRGLAMQFTGLGSMIGVHMTDRPIRSAADAATGNAGLLDLFYFDLVARGIW